MLREQPYNARLRHARLTSSLTQQRLADLIGADRGQVVHWETGRHRPIVAYRERIARATGFPVAFFDHDWNR